jgi:hypothetical protein
MALEYSVSQGGTPAPLGDPGSVAPFFWNSTPIGYDPANPLNGFSIGARYYTSSIDPTSGEETRTYPQWIVVSQTLVTLSPHTYPPGPYSTNTGTELFTVSPGTYSATYQNAGITNGTAYSYSKVFDQTEHYYLTRDYIPPAGAPVDGSIKADPFFPQEPYDPDNNIYPTSAIIKFIPDTRDFVTVTYQLTTKYKLTNSGSTINDTINITQVVTQNINNWTSLAQAQINKTAYKAGLYNTQVVSS